MSKYNGYKLLDEVLIVCRQNKDGQTNEYFEAYVADPNNKQQCKTARDWATVIEWGPYDTATRTYPDKKTLEPIEYKYENKGFTLELLDCARNSSVGGKLSFWNCLLSRGSIKFRIGINTEMLLTLLKEGTFNQGKCREGVCFASLNGKSGVLIEGGASYNAAKDDVTLKAKVKKSLTSNYSAGAHVATLTLDEYYLGEFYMHYKLEDSRNYWHSRQGLAQYADISLIKLKTPKKVHIYCTRTRDLTKFSDCLPSSPPYWWYIDIRDKRSKRVVKSDSLVIDITHEQFIDKLAKNYLFSPHSGNRSDIEQAILICKNEGFGIGTKDSYEVDAKILDLLKAYDVNIVEE